MRIRLGTRPSRLAVIQAEIVAAQLRGAGHEVVIVKVTTEGDEGRPSASLKSAFTKRLEDAIASGVVDAAVHSLKDVPVDLMEGLELVSFPSAEDPSDSFVSSKYADAGRMPEGELLGTSSGRRAALASRHWPWLRVVGLRGNLDTRLRKVMEGQVGAAVLATSGLKRLGVPDGLNVARLDPREFMPAPGQGIIAVEARPGGDVAAALRRINDQLIETRALLEREFSRLMGGGCGLPLGIYSEVGSRISAIAFAVINGEFRVASASGSLDEPAAVAESLRKCILG